MGVSPVSTNSSVAGADLAALAPLSARRLLVLGGVGLIFVGMIFGDIFAVFTLHQNAAHVGASLAAAAHAALAGDTNSVANFQNVGGFLENRGTKVDTHVHMIAFGYLALMLAILQPWIAFAESHKKNIAWIFLFGAALLPVGVFLIHYVGLAYSPLAAIGWASIFADFGGLLVILATLGSLLGLLKYFQGAARTLGPDRLLADRGTPGRMLLAGGLALVLLGFFHGAYYAAADLYKHEELDYKILSTMSASAAGKDAAGVDNALADYGRLQGDKAVNIAAHAHSVEFGLLAMLLAFFQPYVSLGESWKRRWAGIFLLGSLLLPVCVLLELQFGLVAGGLADFGGLLVIVALLAMWIGILRYTGGLDASLPAAAGQGIER
jgi:heme/copper-type cytochrome/quinol oxidase subunit 4